MTQLGMLRTIILLLLACWPAPAAELRGAWLAHDSLESRTKLVAALETLAANNFNAVYVNAWSRGYPMWPSEVFRRQTGLLTYPAYAGRDVLGETIVEAHRLGLEVHAWMEYGFVGGVSSYFPGRGGRGPIFEAHPDWLTRDSKGAGALDHVTPQIYRNTTAQYQSELESQMRQVDAQSLARMYPGIDTTNRQPSSEVVEMVRATRAAKLEGMVFWYYTGLLDHFAALQAQVFREPAAVPGRAAGWRREVDVVEESSDRVERSAGWQVRGQGWSKSSLAATAGNEWISYRVSVPRTGFYEVYAYVTPSAGNTSAARYSLLDSAGAGSNVTLDQRNPLNEGWTRLGEVLLQAGQKRAVVKLTSEGLAPGETVVADAVLFIRGNRRPLPRPSVRAEGVVKWGDVPGADRYGCRRAGP